MSKLTVKEYANIRGVSVQSVYKKIKESQLECQEIKGIKYIIIQDEINYEKKFNELQLRHESLKDSFDILHEMVKILKIESKRYYNLLPKPKKSKSEKPKKHKKKKKKKK